MKINTSNLLGPALGWIVAQCEQITLTQASLAYQVQEYGSVMLPHGGRYVPYEDWAQGGPIIERERIATREIPPVSGDNGHIHTRRWIAEMFRFPGGPRRAVAYGTTPLVAAMRCYVASKCGDIVDIPDELIGG